MAMRAIQKVAVHRTIVADASRSAELQAVCWGIECDGIAKTADTESEARACAGGYDVSILPEVGFHHDA